MSKIVYFKCNRCNITKAGKYTGHKTETTGILMMVTLVTIQDYFSVPEGWVEVPNVENKHLCAKCNEEYNAFLGIKEKVD